MLIEYLEAVPGVQHIRAGENPATWMLEVTGGAAVTGKSKAAKVDFAEYYKVSAMSSRLHRICKASLPLDVSYNDGGCHDHWQ